MSRRAARRVRTRTRGGDSARRLEFVVGELGSNRTAKLLRVSESQPSRWGAGLERMGPESRRRLADLDYVLGRLLDLYPLEVADVWLTSFNAHLGARPVDVLELGGVARVILAVDAEAAGAFA